MAFAPVAETGATKLKTLFFGLLSKPTSDPWSSRINSQGFSGARICFSRPRLRAGEGWKPRLLRGGTSGGQLSSPGGACWLSECGLGLPRAPFWLLPRCVVCSPSAGGRLCGLDRPEMTGPGSTGWFLWPAPPPPALSLQRLLGFEELCARKGVQAEQTSEVTSVASPVKRGRGSH